MRQKMRLNGRYYDGQTAESHTVQLVLDNDGFIHAHPPLIQPVSLKEITLSNRVGNIARTLTFPSGGVFETNDHETLDHWLGQQQIDQGFVHKLESSMKYVMAAVAFMALFVAWTVFYGIPWFSTVAADALPVEASIYIGSGAMESMDDRFFSESELDDERQRVLTKQFTQLLPDPENNDVIKYKLLFRKGGFIGANAFALPDGTVVVTDELVELSEHDEELLSVLLHEIGHVEHRHSLRQVISHSGLAILTVLITGDVNSAGSLILALPNVLMSSSYSRDHEWEADGYALAQMQKLGIPPSRFADFMEKLEVYEPEFEDEWEDEDQDFIENEEVTDEPTNVVINSDPDDPVDQADLECETAPEEDDIDLGWFNYISSHPPSEDRIARFRSAGSK